MDIEEAKKITRNKIYSDYLTNNVRNIIKEEEWKKQDRMENFKEIFYPIIKSQNNIKKSLDDKQNENINRIQNNQDNIRQLIDEIIRNRRTEDNRDLIDSNRELIDQIIRNRRTEDNRDLIDSNRELIDQIIRNRRTEDSNREITDEIIRNRELIDEIIRNRRTENSKLLDEIMINRDLITNSTKEIEREIEIERERERDRELQLEELELELERERERERDRERERERDRERELEREGEREGERELERELVLERELELERDREREGEDEDEDEDEDELILPNTYSLNEEEINQRFDELTSKNSMFDKNLIDKNIIKKLSNHNFFSFPSDFNEYDDYDKFNNRVLQVKNLLNKYYNKIKKYVDIKNYQNYNYLEIKNRYQNENENFLRFLNDDINNFNVLSLYFTNLLYLDYYKSNEDNSNQDNSNQDNY